MAWYDFITGGDGGDGGDGLLAKYGGAIVGGLLGASGGGDTQTSSSANKTPWAPAQPYLLDNLKTNASLQNSYQQNPFNAQQQTSYNNTFGDLNNFRNSTAPGLMQFANSAMSGSYQRPQHSAPGMAGYSPGQQYQQQAAVQPMQTQQPQQGPFSVGNGNFSSGDDQSIEGMYRKYLGRAPEAEGLKYWQGQFGDSIDPNEVKTFLTAAQPEINQTGGSTRNTTYTAPDWNAANPFKNGSMPVTTMVSATAPAISGGLLGNGVISSGGGQNGGIGMNGTPSDGTTSGNIYGIGSSFDSDKAQSVFAKASLLGLPVAAISSLIAGFTSGQMTQDQIDAQVASLDKALAEKDARNHPDTSYGLNTSFGGGGGYGGPGTGNGNGGGSNDRGTGNQRD